MAFIPQHIVNVQNYVREPIPAAARPYITLAQRPIRNMFTTNIADTFFDEPIFTTQRSYLQIQDQLDYTIPMLEVRKDVNRSINIHLRTNNDRAAMYIRAVITSFDTLWKLFPIGVIRELNRPLTFAFMNRGPLAILLVCGIPALEFYKDNNGPITKAYDFIYLTKILPTNSATTEKYKRLFLRHMGFACTRNNNKILIKYKHFPNIWIDPKKEFSFAHSPESLIGATVKNE